jgi:hypothetical protein
MKKNGDLNNANRTGCTPKTKQSENYYILEWRDNIRMDLREVESKGVDWMHLAQERDQWRALVNMVMNLWVL